MRKQRNVNTRNRGANISAQIEDLSPAMRDLAEQREYEARMIDKHGTLTIMVAKAFVQGMRRNGYRSTGTAIDEFIDNSVQAGAKRVDVVFGFDGESQKGSPSAIAIVDDGHGMDGGMIRLAMMWGGSHRADKNDRSGFGRFGFGLPTAALSQGEAYTVASRPPDGSLRAVRFDVNDLSKYAKGDGLEMPEHQPARLPPWLQQHINKHFNGFEHGTIVLLQRLDNLTWKTATNLETNLIRHLGLYYRGLLSEVRLYVNGKVVPPIDPLFLTEGAQYFECADGLRAEEAPRSEIPVKDPETGAIKGIIRVRYAYLPYGFAEEQGLRLPSDTKQDLEIQRIKRARYQILKETGGIIVMRHGRQLDVVKFPGSDRGWLEWIPRDIYWGIELDFPASLDEEFNVSTTKQGVTVSARIWDLLKEAGVKRAISDFRARHLREVEKAKEQARARAGGPEEAVAAAMSIVALQKRRKFLGDDRKRIAASVERFDREIKRRAKETNVAVDLIADGLQKEVAERPYILLRESAKDGPFYRVDTFGTQKQLVINIDHPFYTRCYAPAPDPAKSAFLLFLFVLADAEIDVSTEAAKEFYQTERREWSETLRKGIAEYLTTDPLAYDSASTETEELSEV